MLVGAISLLLTNASKKIIFEKIFCIYYLIQIYQNKIQALFINKSKINSIISNQAQKFCLKIRKTVGKAHKIDSFVLKTFGIIIAKFQIKNNIGRF